MKLPGITHISYIPCGLLTPNLALAHLSGIPVGISAPDTPIHFSGSPECEAVSAIENNGRVESTSLTFRTAEIIPLANHLAFLITSADGSKYIIGTNEEYPTIQITTGMGTPSGSPAGYLVEVKLTALKSLIPITS